MILARYGAQALLQPPGTPLLLQTTDARMLLEFFLVELADQCAIARDRPIKCRKHSSEQVSTSENFVALFPLYVKVCFHDTCLTVNLSGLLRLISRRLRLFHRSITHLLICLEAAFTIADIVCRLHCLCDHLH